MAAQENTTPSEVLQRVIWIQTLTLIWMSVEAAVSLFAAWRAGGAPFEMVLIFRVAAPSCFSKGRRV